MSDSYLDVLLTGIPSAPSSPILRV